MLNSGGDGGEGKPRRPSCQSEGGVTASWYAAERGGMRQGIGLNHVGGLGTRTDDTRTHDMSHIIASLMENVKA